MFNKLTKTRFYVYHVRKYPRNSKFLTQKRHKIFNVSYLNFLVKIYAFTFYIYTKNKRIDKLKSLEMK